MADLLGSCVYVTSSGALLIRPDIRYPRVSSIEESTLLVEACALQIVMLVQQSSDNLCRCL